jgi:hypothetical protein
MLVALNAASILLRFGGYIVKYVTLVITSVRLIGAIWHTSTKSFLKKISSASQKMYLMKTELNLGINTSLIDFFSLEKY